MTYINSSEKAVSTKEFQLHNHPNMSISSFIASNKFHDFNDFIAQLSSVEHMQYSLASEPLLLSPQLVVDFFKALTKRMKPRFVLDPYSKMGQIAIGISELGVERIDAIFQDSVGLEILTRFPHSNIEPALENNIEVNDDRRFSLIISDFPFALKTTFAYRGIVIRDMSLKRIAQNIPNLETDGYMAVTLPGSVLARRDSSRVFREFEKDNLYINAVIDLPPGTFSPYTGIASKIVVFKRVSAEYRFVAELKDPNSMDIIVDNLLKQKSHKNPALGVMVDAEKFNDYGQFKVHNDSRKIAKAYNGELVKLNDVYKTVMLQNRDGSFEESVNCVFIPKVGTSQVVTNESAFTIKAQNYFQVILRPDLVLPAFCALFYNSHEGVQIRKSSQPSSFVPGFSMTTIKQTPFVLPSIAEQRAILDANEAIAEYETQISSIRRSFFAAPTNYKNILKHLKKVGRTDAFEDWVETLPFPLATILRKYLGYTNNKEKRDSLLVFFEALAQYLSTILLSCAYKNRELLKGTYLLKKFDTASLSRATFGTWMRINSEAAKSIRTMISNGKYSDVISSVFGGMSQMALNQLCDKALYGILETANNQRNEWLGHPADFENAYEDQISELYNQVLQVRGILDGFFEEVWLVRVKESKKSGGRYINTVEKLMSSNSLFYTEDIKSDVDVLDDQLLYIYIRESNIAIELLQLLRMDSSPPDIKNACYFYSSYGNGGTRYVSHHYSDKPQRYVEGNAVLTSLVNAIDLLQDHTVTI